MKTLLVSALGLALLTCSASFVSAQDGPMFPPPGPEQKALEKLAGEWEGKMTCHMMPEGQKESEGTYSCKMGVGGYFLLCEIKADLGGMPFEGRAITGYDPFQKKYTGTWVDSMSPTLYATEGSFDKAGKVYTETMTGADPAGKPMKFRSTTTIVDADHMKFEMFGTMPGATEEQLMMEIAYTRTK